MNSKEKIKHFAELKGLSGRAFCEEIGVSNGFFNSGKSFGVDILLSIIDKFGDFNLQWFLTGKGNPIIPETELENILQEDLAVYGNKGQKGVIPFFNLTVSAGNSLTDIQGGLSPDGFIKDIPGTRTTEAFLPVHGYSMYPEIKEGSIIGVRKAESWDHLNTQHKYLIITKEDRMVKYIEYDKENNDILWCKSPNYGDFNILKSDIIEIHRVTFVMNPE